MALPPLSDSAAARGPSAPAEGDRRRIVLPGPLALALKTAVSLTLIAYIAASLDWQGVVRTIPTADIRLLALALFAVGLVPVLAAERWRLAAAAGGIGLQRRFFVSATYTALFAGQFLPTGVGADAVRLALLWRRNVSLQGGFQSLVVDRICGVGALIVLMSAGTPFLATRLPDGSLTPIWWAFLFIACGFAALLYLDRLPFLAASRPKWVEPLLSLVVTTRSALASSQAFGAFALSFVIHVVAISSVVMISRALGFPVGFWDLITPAAVAIFASMLPISLNGWGVREGAMIVGLSILSVPGEIAVMVSLLYGVYGVLWSLPGGVLWYSTLYKPGDDAGARPSSARSHAS